MAGLIWKPGRLERGAPVSCWPSGICGLLDPEPAGSVAASARAQPYYVRVTMLDYFGSKKKSKRSEYSRFHPEILWSGYSYGSLPGYVYVAVAV